MNHRLQSVLIVDDVAANIEVLAEILKTRYQTLAARTGEEAVSRAAAAPQPDLILLDIVMPGMDGYEVCRRLKAGPATRDIPVIFVTAADQAEDEARGLDIGAVDYITRPFSPAIVQARVRTHLSLARRRQETESRYKTLFDSAGDGIAIHDLSGRFLEVNRKLCERLGYARDELLGMRIEGIRMPGQPHRLETRLERMREEGCGFYEGLYVAKGGDIFAVEVNSQLIRYAGEQAVLSIARDITERKRAEARLRAAERELADQQALMVRTDRLRSLGEMAAGIAHELNQPLVGVRGMAEHLRLALQRGWDLPLDKVHEKLDGIIGQADRMTHIVEHVRLFAREAGKSALQPVDVNEAVRSATNLLEAQFRSRGIDLILDLADGLPPVLSNPFSLEEVILNLLINARDATEERMEAEKGKPGAGRTPFRITVWTAVDGPPSERSVRIEAIDDGVGVPETLTKRIFEPFFTTKGPEKGTGLGLAICRHLVEQSGGAIGVCPSSTGGTRMIVRLPEVRPDPPPGDPAPPP